MRKPELIGKSRAMADLRADIAAVGPTTANVVISGESGVGHHTAARLIHEASARSHEPFDGVSCSPPPWPDFRLAQELFGPRKGRSMSTDKDPRGALERVNGGTLFINSIEHMPATVQASFLTFLETGIFQHTVTKEVKRSNVRVIAGTSRNLAELVAEGKFRGDLFDRLKATHLRIPTLRERREDIPLLIDYFWKWFFESRHPPITRPPLGADVVEALTRYSWPENVAEMEQVLSDLFFNRPSNRPVSLDDLPPEIRQSHPRETASDFEITLSPDFSPQQVKALLTTLAEYYRACGGLGLAMTFEAEHVAVEEPVSA